MTVPTTTPKVFSATERSEWREWLSENFEKETEIWFMFPMKASGEDSISYNDAVEEALCFGWIDSTIKHIDPLHRIQRFTPRRKGSKYSQPNIERLVWLDSRGLIHPKIKEGITSLIEKPYEFPSDILDVLKSDAETWKNFDKFSAPYKRIRIAYVDAARNRPDEFKKRLNSLVVKTKAGKMIAGFGGIDKYYK